MHLITISPPKNISRETEIVQRLFEEYLQFFHLRKPEMSFSDMKNYINRIPQKFHNRIIIHSNFELLNEFDLKGIHLNSRCANSSFRASHKSKSCHSFEEIQRLDNSFSYAFLSPIFDSISKENYKSNFSFDELKNFLSNRKNNCKIIALGGIGLEQVSICKELGFDGVAILGFLWKEKNTESIIKKFLQLKEECDQQF